MTKLVELELEHWSQDDLLSCMASSNRAQVYDIIHNPKSKFKGANGPVLAVVKLQTAWRRHKAHTAYSQLKFLMKKATVI